MTDDKLDEIKARSRELDGRLLGGLEGQLRDDIARLLGYIEELHTNISGLEHDLQYPR